MNRAQIIAVNLQFLKRSRNYTREQVAHFIGVNVRSWDSYVEGRALPKIETLIAVSDHFNVPVDEIVRIQLGRIYSVVVESHLERIEPKLTIEQ